MEYVFSQKTLNKLRELSRLAHFLDFDMNGVSVLWFNPEFSNFSKRVATLKTHSHTFYEVHFVLEGTCVYSGADGEMFTAEKNGFIFIPPCEHHRFVSKSDSCKKISFAFSHTPVGSNDYIFSKEIYAVSLCAWMEAVFSSLVFGLERNNGTEFQVFQNVLSLLILLVTDKKMSANPKEHQTLPNERISRAKSFIEDNSARDISVEEVASYVYLSSKHLGHLFKENGNVTIAEYIAKARCNRAQKMLENTDIPISEIVDTLCFSNKQNFNRFFKRIMGITPGAYRKLTKPNATDSGVLKR